MSNKKYSDEDKASAIVAMKMNNGRVNNTARKIGVSAGALSQWANGKNISDQAKINVKRKAGKLAEKCEDLIHQFLDSIDEQAIGKANLLQRTTAACQLIDKMFLLKSQRDGKEEEMSDEELQQELYELIAAAKENQQMKGDEKELPSN